MTDQTLQHYAAGIDEGDYALEHGASNRTYVMVAIILAVMTAVEVAVSYAKDTVKQAHDGLLLALMVGKFVAVAFYFMHLKFDHALCKKIFFFGVIVAALVYAGTLATFQFWAPGYR